ncbi:hypothetical protein [Mycolicibacterium hippocampi]|uniref:Polyketide cyclase n=1 Tax=Mycolicibacterium hippocampi TaxID=659824 RepID=A0A7I9ZMM9_9MYCO|nr:hypothetical protein [Mycolicibacterium hippocampi]GFH02292.1 hypothetical protein MHIP_27750 [Mycolicibacterium hippocampi]
MTARGRLATAMALVGLAIGYQTRVRPWMYFWGASREEMAQGLPGDELVDTDGPRTTRAVTVDAGPEAIWPWLAQIGENRGGFYSYSFLERAVGADIHNANVIHPEWQDVQVGDTVWLARRGGDRGRQVVAAAVPKSHLVLMSPEDYERLQRGEKASGSWSFHLLPEGRRTRLLARGNGGFGGNPIYDIAHFVMERKMLLGIRRRAEQQAWGEAS